MIDIDPKIDFEGFMPSRPIRQLCREISDNLYWEAPSDSVIRLTIERRQSRFYATCKVASEIQSFEFEFENSDPLSALHKLKRQAVEAIRLWKISRIPPDIPFGLGDNQQVG